MFIIHIKGNYLWIPTDNYFIVRTALITLFFRNYLNIKIHGHKGFKKKKL